MAELATAVLSVLSKIALIAQEMKDAGRQADRLVQRLLSIAGPIRAMQESNRHDDSSVAVAAVLNIVEEAHNFLFDYRRANRFTRACKRKAHADEFADLSGRLTELVQALHLKVAVSTWASEDETDRAEDLEHMLGLLEEMEFNRRGNHDEVMRVLQELQQAERRQLNNWVEIDCQKELEDMDFPLGCGGFGTVRLARWNGTTVAVKYLTHHSPKRDIIHDLRREILVHQGLHFPFVVQLYGASTTRPNLCLVMEHAVGGNLREFLSRDEKPLGYALQAALLHDIARGMMYLHDRGVLHRDLKSTNVLVFENDRLKLCDFGLAKLRGDAETITNHRGLGTVQWMSPEEFEEGSSTQQTDVFGMVCFEVATRREPFPSMKAVNVMHVVAVRRERPNLPEASKPSPDVTALMERCWQHEPTDRPSGFHPVVQALSRAVEAAGGDPRANPAYLLGGGESAQLRDESNYQDSCASVATTTVESFSADRVGDESTIGKASRDATSHIQSQEDRNYQNKVAQGLIAPVTPGENRNGGGPFCFNGKQTGEGEALTVKTLTVWTVGFAIKAVELVLTDDWSRMQEGRHDDDDPGTSFTFLAGETIASMSTWTNGSSDERMLRAGGFEFTTSMGRSFSASAKNRGRKHSTDVGCGIVVGAHGRSGLDVDSFNFIFVQKASRVELQNLSYANLDAVDISTSVLLIEEDSRGFSQLDESKNIVKDVTNTTSVQHTWSKTFEHSVDPQNLTLKGDLAVLSCEAGQWKVNVNRKRPVLWEGIGDAKEEKVKLQHRLVVLEGVTDYRIVMDEASCAIPFNATLCITAEDGGVISFPVKGELKLVAFGNVRSTSFDVVIDGDRSI